ncbi:MAG TPA: hypothetical protein VF049_21345 [Nocardioidaceae bacterium]|jgi:hypothetical protein
MNTKEHVNAANELLRKAAAVEATPRCHLAKAYAEMANAHANLALVEQIGRLADSFTTPPTLTIGARS